MKEAITGFCIAAVLWTVMFSPWTAPHVNFWVMMTCSGMALTLYSTWAAPGWWKGIKLDLDNILLGAGLAAVLWGGNVKKFRARAWSTEVLTLAAG